MSASRALSVLAVALAVVCAGCATPVTVTSEPPGASVYSRGKGRAAYRWTYRGNTPVTFEVPYNALLTYVRWPDGTRSNVRESDLLGEPAAELRFQQAPAPQEARRTVAADRSAAR